MNKTKLKKLKSECKKIWNWKLKWEKCFEYCVIKQSIQLSFNFKKMLVIETFDCCVISNTIHFYVEFMGKRMETKLSESHIEKIFPNYHTERCDIVNKIACLNLRYGLDHFYHETWGDCWAEIEIYNG